LDTDKTAGFFSTNEVFPIDKEMDLVLTTTLVTTIDGIFHTDESLKVDLNTKRPIIDAKKWIKFYNQT